MKTLLQNDSVKLKPVDLDAARQTLSGSRFPKFMQGTDQCTGDSERSRPRISNISHRTIVTGLLQEMEWLEAERRSTLRDMAESEQRHVKEVREMSEINAAIRIVAEDLVVELANLRKAGAPPPGKGNAARKAQRAIPTRKRKS